jgi:prepilin-type N-terminal cleavage/methylation domain-containing protein
MVKAGDRGKKLSFGKSNHKNVIMKKQPKQAFTLIELLTVIAIIGILASILIPTVGRVREAARRTVDASNIRQIGQASLIYANDNNERLPPRGSGSSQGLSGTGNTVGNLVANTQTPNIYAIAAALARSGGLNDASIWISSSDRHQTVDANNQTTILTGLPASRILTPTFASSGVSFAYIAGRSTSQPSTHPIAFTRGLNQAGGDGKWVGTGNAGVYGSDGGHIVFLGGNVQFYKDVGATAQTGIFTNHSGRGDAGQRTNAIMNTVSAAEAIYSQPGGPSGAPAGQAGSN